jgi:hypothetical protein
MNRPDPGWSDRRRHGYPHYVGQPPWQDICREASRFPGNPVTRGHTCERGPTSSNPSPEQSHRPRWMCPQLGGSPTPHFICSTEWQLSFPRSRLPSLECHSRQNRQPPTARFHRNRSWAIEIDLHRLPDPAHDGNLLDIKRPIQQLIDIESTAASFSVEVSSIFRGSRVSLNTSTPKTDPYKSITRQVRPNWRC